LPLHTLPAGQAAPHPPQLALSVNSLAQLTWPPSPPQTLKPARHEVPQTPAAQACPEGHLVPQVPQLAWSVSGLTHRLSQARLPSGQTTVQTPAVQACPALQTLPQAPQLFESVWIAAQTPRQLLVLSGQLEPQPSTRKTEAKALQNRAARMCASRTKGGYPTPRGFRKPWAPSGPMAHLVVAPPPVPAFTRTAATPGTPSGSPRGPLRSRGPPGRPPAVRAGSRCGRAQPRRGAR
jgi:hypothetical protein